MRALLLPALLLLPACSLFDDSDPREGTESAEDCAERLSGQLEIRQAIQAAEAVDGEVVPTYTFDITKMDLTAINEMIVPASENERGSLRTSAFGATAPPVEAFMELEVTEAGAFYFGENPSLYRVRGAALAADAILQTGCERQQPNMRLTGFTLTNASSPAGDTSDNESDTAE
ncbi:MAG: hypothetical protein AAGL68_01345 [Pseudomonadota bacterium]